MIAHRDIVVVGASAGGTEALTRLVHDLPSSFPAAMFVVVHFPGSASSVLPRILSRAGSLPAIHADDGLAYERGRIYVARPDCHLMLLDGRVAVRRGPKENNSRPAIDPLFRSAARSARSRVIGVVLSGNLDDGTAGLLSITQHGGIAVVQDPETAAYPSMPCSAIDHVPVDYVVPLETMAALSGDSALEQVALEAVNRRGKPMRCTVTLTPLLGTHTTIRGVILLMEEAAAA